MSDDFAPIAALPEGLQGQNDVIDNIIQSDTIAGNRVERGLAPEEPDTEALVEQLSEPWFVSTPQPGPIIACRLLASGWDIVIADEHSPLTQAQKNRLVTMLGFKLRRHEKQKNFTHGVSLRKTQAQKDAEIRAALQESLSRGLLTGV